MSWLSAFLLTQLIEVPIYTRCLAHRTHRWLIAFGASAMTHPVVFFCFPELWPDAYVKMVLLAEAFAVLVEGAWLSFFGVRNSLSWALLANALSVAIGLACRSTIGWP